MIKIVCVGKIKEAYLDDLINDYLKRIQKYHKIQIVAVKDNDDINKESQELLKVIDKRNYNIGLFIEGKTYTSLEFAEHINSLFNNNSTITFIIGGSNGLSNQIRELCNEEISFSNFTFPHGLFRGILLEQIYRAFKINNNERYHK